MKPIRDFKKQLENFEQEVAVVSCYVYAEMALQVAISKSKPLLAVVNRTPQFWKTSLAAYQSAAYITLGRIFDLKSPLNIEQLMKAIEADMGAFTPNGLYARRMSEGGRDASKVAQYVEGKYTLLARDVKRLRRSVEKWRAVYDRAVMPVRHQYLAHRQTSGHERVKQLYGAGKVKEMWLITRFLRRLAYALRELYSNGRAPLLSKRGRYSPKEMLAKNEKWAGEHERVVGEVRILAQVLIKGGA